MCKQQSLRGIKREETVHALAQAAFELALELGMDGFVIEDIVQRARYSRRTFANYFSCKEEAVAMAALTFSGVNEAEILHLPESTPPLDALQQWMRMQLTADLLWKLRELVSLSKQYPTLVPYLLSVLHRLQTAAQEALSGLYNDRYPSEYTHLLTGAVFGAILPIVNGSLIVLLPGDSIAEKPGATTFDQYWDTTFGYLRNGF